MPEARPYPWWVRLLILLPALLLTYGAAQGITYPVLAAAPWLTPLVGLALATGLVFAYRGLIRWTERRGRPSELSPGRPMLAAGAGLVLGMALMALVVGAIAVVGRVEWLGWGAVPTAVGSVGFWIVVGVGEELIFRGVLFRIVEERGGTWIALLVTSVVFGGVHLTNPDATVTGAVAIAAEAGILLGAAYVLTRSLWLPIGIHIGWNLAQGTLFGAQVSGSGVDGMALVRTAFEGPQLLTGGAFGPEASVTAVALGLAAGTVMLTAARRRGRWIARPVRR